jgi:hypothetical protein
MGHGMQACPVSISVLVVELLAKTMLRNVEGARADEQYNNGSSYWRKRCNGTSKGPELTNNIIMDTVP